MEGDEAAVLAQPLFTVALWRLDSGPHSGATSLSFNNLGDYDFL
jgi:hypothetical protein